MMIMQFFDVLIFFPINVQVRVSIPELVEAEVWEQPCDALRQGYVAWLEISKLEHPKMHVAISNGNADIRFKSF